MSECAVRKSDNLTDYIFPAERRHQSLNRANNTNVRKSYYGRIRQKIDIILVVIHPTYIHIFMCILLPYIQNCFSIQKCIIEFGNIWYRTSLVPGLVNVE